MRSARERGPRASMAASAASTTVSVSGRGTSVAASTRSGRLQNSLPPTMRATGSPARRRSASAAIASFLVRIKTARARGRQGCMVEAERVADENAGIEVGRIEPGGAKPRRHGAPCVRDGGRMRKRGVVGARHQLASSAASSAA